MSEIQLIEALENYPKFQELALDEREVILKMASLFAENPDYLFKNAVELVAYTSVGNQHKWSRFLNLDPVKAYIDRQMAEVIAIGNRKGIGAAVQRAEQGDNQTIRQLNDLAGIFAKRDSNKVVVLHQIQRPE